MNSYKLLRISNLYPEYIKYFYKRNPHIRQESYNMHYHKIMDDTSDPNSYMSDELNKLGVESRVVLSNAEPLQDSWRKENNIKKADNLETITQQIKKFNPDILWIDDAKLLNADYLNYLRKETAGLKLIVAGYCTNFNCERLKQFKALDFLLTCTPGFKKSFSQEGLKSYLVYFSFEESILERTNHDNNFVNTEVLFTGSLLTGRGNHNQRIHYLESILKENIPLTIYGNLETRNRLWIKKNFHRIMKYLSKNQMNGIIDGIPILKNNRDFATDSVVTYSSKLRKVSHPPIFGIEMLKVLSKSKISLNQHAEVAGNFAGNIRLFEATGVGACLLTDNKSNLSELFEIGKEIVVYENKNDCIEKIKYLINNPSERMSIADAGQKRTLKDHTIKKRASEIHQIFLGELRNI